MAISVLASARVTPFNLAFGDGLVVGRVGSVYTTADTAHAIVGAGANALTVTGYVATYGSGANTVEFAGGNHTIVVDATGTLLASRGIGINLGAGGKPRRSSLTVTKVTGRVPSVRFKHLICVF